MKGSKSALKSLVSGLNGALRLRPLGSTVDEVYIVLGSKLQKFSLKLCAVVTVPFMY